MRRPNPSGASGDDVTDPRDGERSVRVLTHLRDYPMRHGPGVDPGDGASGVAALGDDGRSEGDDGERHEFERRRDSGEYAHQKLVRRRAVEPVVQIWGEDLVHRFDVSRSQGVIKLQNHVSVLDL
ncbi:unnamed protein product [Microthlaspi erraticum]|uniref:Uncharacterized protein n=1 Tax=Microthlaspi erraticum TaxID=1685480 RepID=A0A6D2JKA9_9BRAS|nr:unnamed protein product [Microthlaspi erraticum]